MPRLYEETQRPFRGLPLSPSQGKDPRILAARLREIRAPFTPDHRVSARLLREGQLCSHHPQAAFGRSSQV